jgi:hypothetical protein
MFLNIVFGKTVKVSEQVNTSMYTRTNTEELFFRARNYARRSELIYLIAFCLSSTLAAGSNM